MTTNASSKTPQWTKTRHTPGLAGLAGFSAAALVFGVLIVAVRVRWLPLESVDRGVAADLNRVVADRPTLVSVLKMITLLGSNGVLGWLVAISALILLVRKRWRLAAYLLVTSAGGVILDPTLKIAVGRLRPVVADPVALDEANSFPSGHALASVIGYGALLLVFTPALPRRARTPVIIALATVVVLVGFSRLALGMHYLSDVLGAWCLGIARTRAWWRWLVVAVAVLMPLWVASSRMYRGMHHPTDALGSVILAACRVTAMVYFVRPNRDLDARATTTAAASSTEPTPEPKVGAPV